MILITPLPGITKTRPGSATVPFPGIEAKIMLARGGKEIQAGGGYLAITRPWPAMLRTIWGDDRRYVETYWSKWARTSTFRPTAPGATGRGTSGCSGGWTTS